MFFKLLTKNQKRFPTHSEIFMPILGSYLVIFKRWPPIIVTTGRIQCFRGFRSTDFLFTFNLPFHSERLKLSSTDFVLMLTKWFRHFSLLSVKQPFLLLLYFYFCLYPDTDIKIFYFLSPFLFIFNTFLDRKFRQRLINY